MDMTYYLYILKSKVKETYYRGTTDNPHRRLIYHNSESKGYTQRNRPWELVYFHAFKNKNDALKAEQIVKGWKSKKMTQLLIDGTIDINDYM